MMKTKLLARVVLCLLPLPCFVATGSVLSGCTAAWWATLTSGAGSIMDLVTYVTSFLSGVQALWNTILPLLPQAAQQQASADFNSAVFSVEQTLSALEDALNAAAAAKGPQPDLSALVTSVQKAVDALMAIVERWTGGAATDAGVAAPAAVTLPRASATEAGELARQASVIKRWH